LTAFTGRQKPQERSDPLGDDSRPDHDLSPFVNSVGQEEGGRAGKAENEKIEKNNKRIKKKKIKKRGRREGRWVPSATVQVRLAV